MRFKIRGLDDKRHMRLHPAGGEWALFGLNTVPKGAQAVVITEGEFDAMAVCASPRVRGVCVKCLRCCCIHRQKARDRAMMKQTGHRTPRKKHCCTHGVLRSKVALLGAMATR